MYRYKSKIAEDTEQIIQDLAEIAEESNGMYRDLFVMMDHVEDSSIHSQTKKKIYELNQNVQEALFTLFNSGRTLAEELEKSGW